MFSLTKVSFVTVQNSVIDLRRYFPCNKFKRGRVSNKRWSADHDLLTTDTLASLVDTLALITRRIRILKGGRAAATVNVSEFRRDTLCVCSKWRVAKCGDTLCLCSKWRVAKCGDTLCVCSKWRVAKCGDTLCLCSKRRVAKCGDTLCLCSKWRVAKCGCRLFEARQKVTPAPHELHRNKNVSSLREVEGLVWDLCCNVSVRYLR
jgi:hypothetical protein